MQNQTEDIAAQSKLLNDDIQPYTHALKEYFPSREAVLQEAKAQTQRKGSLNKLATGTILSAILVATWLIDPVLQSQQFTTAIGEQSVHNMADGTVITLNTNSKVTVESHLRSRRVLLAQGEALFNVAHGWRTFTVQANKTQIRDIGTIFNVRNTEDGAIVTVLEGAVEVTFSNKTQMLTQHQTLQTSATQFNTPMTIDSSETTAWQQGKIWFDGTPLSQAVAEIARYHHAPITIADNKAAKLRISGAYDIKSVESLIDTLPVSIAVKIERKANGAVLIRSQ